MRISAALISLMLCLPGTACAESVPALKSAATIAADAPRPYAFWRKESLPDNPLSSVRPSADGAAFPVAPGYFLISMYGMGMAAFDMGEDPRVFVSDGDRMYPGEFVGINTQYRLGLIRADFRPKPFKLAPDSAGTLLLGLVSSGQRSGSYVPKAFPGDSCAEMPIVDEENQRLFSIIGCQVPGETVLGVGYLNARGELAALIAPTARGAAQDGLDSTRIRRFMDVYFASWGREVKPKPSY